MKKYIKLFIILFWLPNIAICQIWPGQEKIYVYNNSKDTIKFNRFKLNFTRMYNPWGGNCSEPKIIDSIQIDGIGKKEIVFYLKCRFSNSQHGGSFDIDESTEIEKYEIWNLDTKNILFEAINYQKNDFKGFSIGLNYENISEYYKYDLTIDSLAVFQ